MQSNEPAAPIATEIVLVIDRSGSMHSLRQATIRGVNEFLDGQRSAGEQAFVSIYQFDHEFAAMFEARAAASAPAISEENYAPRGSTALLDAIGEAVERTRLRVDCCDNDARVVFAVMTDGQENASTRFGVRAIRRLLKACERQGWQVLFLGADIDAVAEGERMGFRAERAARFACSEAGVAEGMRCVSYKAMRFCQSGDAAEMDFAPSERADLMSPPAP